MNPTNGSRGHKPHLETDDNGYGPGLKWEIQLDGDESNWDVWAFSSQKLSTKSKLYQWLAAINPEALPKIGETVDLGDLIGRRVEVMFEAVERDGVAREKVVKIRAAKAKAGYGRGRH